MPIGSTNVVGDGATFSVTAHGVPTVAYQWKWIPDTNNTVTNVIIGANSATLPLVNLATNQSGKYFVTITNSSGYLTTNSAQATLLVTPPPLVNIAALRGMVDPTTFAPTNTTALFTAQGIVTAWADMTGVANTEFYMQDAPGHLRLLVRRFRHRQPAAGGRHREVIGPLAALTACLKSNRCSPTPWTASIISTGNPLPAAQPLPFDPNVTGIRPR